MLRRALGPQHVIFAYSARVIKTSALVLVHFKLVLGFSLFLFVVLSSMLSGELIVSIAVDLGFRVESVN